jgi:pimeloyl-ACP methyl ester carboxylesterase
MTARGALRLLLGGLVTAALLWMAWHWQRGEPVLAVVGALAIALAHAWVLAIEFICVWFVNSDDPAPRPTTRQLLRAWLHEVWRDIVVFAWWQPFRARRIADNHGQPGRRGIVLVHGFFCNRGVFTPWMEELRRRDVPFIAIDLGELFGSIDNGVPSLDDAVRLLRASTGLAPLVVAHSMGGLVVRAWLDRHSADTRVHRVITIGTPHHGTWLARFAFATNTRQMRRAGGWLRAMQAREPAARAARFVCSYSNCDNVVFPASTATLPGADNRHLPGLAHVAMVYDASVLAEAMFLLESPVAQATLAGAAADAR